MRGPTLRIVQINDVYSLESLPRFATLVRHYAVHDPADTLLVVLAGDFLAPSILSSLDGGRGMVECLNAIGITHVVFGNHEDDVPVADLRARVGELRGKWLATNVRGFEPSLPEHDVVEVGTPGGRQVRVGLVGVVMEDATVYRGVPFGGARLEPANAAVLREAASLIAGEDCACIVPLTHQPIGEDRALARCAAEARLAVIVGGHEHVPCLEAVSDTWIVKAGIGCHGGGHRRARVAGRCAGSGPAGHASRDRAAGSDRGPRRGRGPSPPRRRAHGQGARARVGDTDDDPTGRAPLVGRGAARPTSIATLLCSLLRDALGAEACLFNAGGIRASRDYTERFTYGDLKAEVPFDNEVVVVRMPGRVVREAVAASRALAPAESGAFLHADDRVVVEEAAHRVVTVDGAPLDENREYRVAIVRNLLEGMDHIEPLVRFGREHPALVPPVGSGREVKIVLVDAFARALWRKLGGFDAVDADHDGQVTQNEIAQAVARLTHGTPSDVGAALVLNALDVKHQGSITRDEVEPGDEKP